MTKSSEKASQIYYKNRKMRVRPRKVTCKFKFKNFLKNTSVSHKWLITYAIYTSFELKFYFWFSHAKIFEIRPRKKFSVAMNKDKSEKFFKCPWNMANLVQIFSLIIFPKSFSTNQVRSTYKSSKTMAKWILSFWNEGEIKVRTKSE